MALYQELTGQGRVVGGRLVGGIVHSGGATAFSKKGDLSIQHPSNPFKRHKVNAETVVEWEEIDAQDGVIGIVGQAAAMVALPGRVGRAVGAGVGAAFNSGHTVRVAWANGEQSIIGLPEKQFLVLSILLKDLQVVPEVTAGAEEELPPSLARKISVIAASALPKGRQSSAAGDAELTDVTEQIAKLASLHAQGILTDEEFSEKKTELLKRL